MQRLVEARKGLRRPLEVEERLATIAKGLGIAGMDCKRLVEARRGFLEPRKMKEHVAAIVEGIRELGLDRERLVEARQSLLKSPHAARTSPRFDRAMGRLGLQPQSRAHEIERFDMATLLK